MKKSDAWYIREVTQDLYVEIFSGDDPHLTINRIGAGLVRVEIDEAPDLVKELLKALSTLDARGAVLG
jgi:hypothetical protein